MNNNLYHEFETQIKSLYGFEFQKFITKLFIYQYGVEYFVVTRTVRDKGADGVIVLNNKKNVIACYGPKTIPLKKKYLDKINKDFEKYKSYWEGDFEKWMFVTNHDVPSEVVIKINKSKKDAIVLGITNLLEIIFDKKKISSEQRKELGKYLRIEEFFNECNSDEKSESKNAVICCHGKLLNKEFKPSLLSINICKYLVYDRYSHIRIWIGDPNIITRLNEIETLFNKITNGEYRKRIWKRANVEELKSRTWDEIEAKVIVINSCHDYMMLQNSHTKLKQEGFVIVCFNHPNISLSKIYAYDLFNRLESNKLVPILIEDDIHLKKDNSESTSFYVLVQKMLEFMMHLPKDMIPFLRLFCGNEKFDSNFLNLVKVIDIANPSKNIKSSLYDLLCKFGNDEHRTALIKTIELGEEPQLIFTMIMNDLNLIEKFLGIASLDQLSTLVENRRRSLFLLLLASQHFGIRKDDLDILLTRFCMGDSEIIKTIKKDSLPKNKIDFWINTELHSGKSEKFLNAIEYHGISSELSYMWLMVEEHSNDSLQRILKDEDLRLGFKIINSDEFNPQVEEKFKIEENLFIYEI